MSGPCREESFRVLKQQAKDFKHEPQRELKILLVHGLLHLLGFDHEKSKYYNNLILFESKKLLNHRCCLVADNILVFNISDYYNYVTKNNTKFVTATYKTTLEYDFGKYKDGMVVSNFDFYLFLIICDFCIS